MKKRLLSVLLALCMVVCLLPMTALAVEGATAPSPNTSWGNDYEDNEEFTIYDVADLLQFRDMVNSGKSFKGKTVYLDNNINITGIEWEPIGTTHWEENVGTDRSFQGTFDGQGWSIIGLTMTSSDTDKPYYNSMDTDGYYAYGFFGGIYNATVRNVKFANVAIDQPGGGAGAGTATNNNTVGAAVGAALGNSTIENITVSGSVTGHSRAAGVVGYVGGSKNNTTQTNSKYDGLLSDYEHMGTITVSNCTNNAVVISKNETTSHGTAAGICATVNLKAANGGSVTFENNNNTGTITGYFAAGILASNFNEGKSTTVRIVDNTNSGAISSGDAKISGTQVPAAMGITNAPMQKDATGTATISGNVNRGNVTSSNGVAAGITGSVYANARFEGTNTNYGGITGATIAAGCVSISSDVALTGLYNYGTVTVTGDVVYEFKDDLNSDMTTASAKAGGVVAQMSDGSLDGATCASSTLPTSSNGSIYVGKLVGSVTGTASISNVSDDEAIGRISTSGNGNNTVTLTEVDLDTLTLKGTHNAQDNEEWYTLKLVDSSIGTATVTGQVHTGLNLAISGGSIEELVFHDVTGHGEGNEPWSSDSYTTVNFKAGEGAQIGTLRADMESRITILRVGTAEGSTIDVVDIQKQANESDVTAVYMGSNAAHATFDNKGTIATLRTVYTTKSNSSTVGKQNDNSTMPTNVLYVTDKLNTTATDILSGGDGAPANFTGVELTVGGSTTTITTDSWPTVAEGKTLVVGNGVTLDMSGVGASENSGAILNYGTIKVKDADSAAKLGTVSNYGKVVYDGNEGDTSASGDNITNYYTVTFVVEGETYHTEIVKENETVSAPTVPTRTGYTFAGWYSGDAAYDFETSITGALTLTAHWNRIYVTPTYTPTVTDSEGGTTTVTPSRPSSGQTVTITTEPDEGYEVDEVTVTDRNGNEVEVTDNGNGTYSFTQPSGGVTIAVTYAEDVCDGTDADNCPLLAFDDLDPSKWYHEYVEYAIENGLMVGTGDTTFSPETPVTRAQVVTVLWRLENEPEVDYTMTFEDVAADQWYTKAIRWAASLGIVGGYSDAEYGTDDYITRQDMATILYRYASYKGYDVSASGELDFTDAENVKDYALAAMQWVCGAGIYEGNGDGTVNPLGDTRRCEYATLMMRFIEGFVTP